MTAKSLHAIFDASTGVTYAGGPPSYVMQQPSLPLTSSGKFVGAPEGLGGEGIFFEGGFSWQWETHWIPLGWKDMTFFPLKWLKKSFINGIYPRHSSVSLSASGALVTHGWANKSGIDHAGSFKYIVMRLWNEHGVFTWTLLKPIDLYQCLRSKFFPTLFMDSIRLIY